MRTSGARLVGMNSVVCVSKSFSSILSQRYRTMKRTLGLRIFGGSMRVIGRCSRMCCLASKRFTANLSES